MIIKWIKESIIIPLEDIIDKIDELRYSVSEQIKCLSDSKYDIIKEKNEEILSLQTQLARAEEKNAYLQEQLKFYDNISEKIAIAISENFKSIFKQLTDSFEKKTEDILIEKNKTLNDLCEVLTKQNEFLKNKNDTLSKICDSFARENEITKEAMGDKEDECAELIHCLDVLCGGAYNSDYVEFFALKTYRGWKCICYDGELLKDFSDVLSVNMEWVDSEKLKLRVEKCNTQE